MHAVNVSLSEQSSKNNSVFVQPSLQLKKQKLAQAIKGKPEAKSIYVLVSKQSGLGQEVREFEFTLAEDGKTYSHVFGQTVLEIFQPLKYQRMMNKNKKEALAANKEEAKQLTKGPVITYAASAPWTTVEAFPELENIFDFSAHVDNRFVHKFLTVFKPRDNDCEGWIYMYERKADSKKLADGVIADIVLFKVGRTVKTPQQRIGV